MSHPSLQDLIEAWRDGVLSDEQAIVLNAMLRESDEARQIFRLESELHGLLHTAVMASVIETTTDKLTPLISPAIPKQRHWLQWRPLTAAAAGIVFGMFCTSVVYGFVAPRIGAVKKVPLTVFDAGLEDEKQTLEDGLPARVGQWGMDAATVVSAESAVKPLQGRRMMRLEPISRKKNVKNHTSRVYQVLDLRALPTQSMNGDAEVQVTASFCSTNSDVSSRYLIRALALEEAPEQAMRDFWSKSETDGVVSESQRFDTKPADPGWHTFSIKVRLPPGSKTLVLIFGAVPLGEAAQQAFVHYLDDVHVSVLIPQAALP